MAVNAVNQKASVQQQSGSERAYRTFNPGGAAIYDIGKALLEGKSIKESYDKADKNMKETQKQNRKKVKEAMKKTVKEVNEKPVESTTVPFLTFLKNLF